MDEIDPIEELHEIRRKLMKKAGGTPEAYVRYIMEQQKLHPEGLVDLSKPKNTEEQTRPKTRKARRESAYPQTGTAPQGRRTVT